jgi:hypothetical protein
MSYRIRPPRLLQDGGGPYHHCPITGERHRINHTGVSQKQIVNLIMDRYPEPPKDTESKEPDPPKQLSIAPTTMLPPLTRVPVPSYPITQAHLLGLSAQDHDLVSVPVVSPTSWRRCFLINSWWPDLWVYNECVFPGKRNARS